ncbi:sensor histidine kinase [Sandaracinus amylolyticus]|uniref:histidine kinase n=1 Tax=Sandaracinus amylolyticus TaxID=927083 RepID=A0A0F6W8K5_9BACT|nr:HAMP domain-containing sensor histidine kinase [Sandaracinus amylolyticus]AKF10077.1 Sensory box histidine kinase/response regulator [Sandaracinus amylolyticus]
MGSRARVGSSFRVRASLAVIAASTVAIVPWATSEGASWRALSLGWVVLAWGLLALASVYGAARLGRMRRAATTLGGPTLRSVALAQARARLRARLDALRTRAHEKRRIAERAQRSKEEFLAAVSHELRTPLNSIQGFAEVLLSEIEGPLSPSQREDVEAIHTAGAYLKELVDEVLDSSSRRTPIASRLELVDLAALVREVARLVEVQRRDKPITIEVDIAPDLARVPADARRIRQILLNLGANAVKFTKKGHVRFRAEGGATREVRLAVEDTGPGIAREDLDRIFRTFERVDTNRGRTEGWGLGLAIAREMAQWHGGRIEVQSTVGRGSTFTLVLPAQGGPSA